MRLDNQQLYSFFVEKQILALYHANTVGTCITFFEKGGLMSRGYVEGNGYPQTLQSSDNIDKVLNVWNDVFIDTSDLHSYFGRENHYGPILFEFDRELIRDENFEIWITKNNPIYWKPDTSAEDRYFQSMQEVRQRWDAIQRQRKMITIKNPSKPILFNYVRRVIVDDPKVTITEEGVQTHVFNAAFHRIKAVISDDHSLKGKFITRTCESCWCTSNYLHQKTAADLKRMFLD